MNRDVVFLRPPQRIVSLVPSDTDTLFALGAGDRVVGRTRYCVEPRGQVEHIPQCGGTKDIDVDAVAALAPDLVLCNKEENARPALEALAQQGHQVFVSFPCRVAEGIAHVARLARILGVAAEPSVRELIRRGHALVSGAAPEPAVRVFMPIWMDPLMTLDSDTFGSDILALAGAENVFADRHRRYPLAADLGRKAPVPAAERDTRYPRITLAEVVERAPDAVFLPDEPHAFSADDKAVFSGLAIPAAERSAIVQIDGKDVFWYGARSIEALPRLRALVQQIAQ